MLSLYNWNGTNRLTRRFFVKNFMIAFSVFTLFTPFISFAAVMDSIPDDGMPSIEQPKVEQPSENFSYICHVEVSQQIYGKDGNSCYVSFATDSTFNKGKTASGALKGADFKNLNFKQVSGDGGCDKTLNVDKDNTLLSMNVYRNKGGGKDHGKFEVSLNLQVAPSGGDGGGWGSSGTRVRYDVGHIESSTSFSTKDMLLSISGECDNEFKTK
jgi:hypothetical protein